MCSPLSDSNVSLSAWISSAGIPSIPDELYLFNFAVAIYTWKGLDSRANGSEASTSICLISLTLSLLINQDAESESIKLKITETAFRNMNEDKIITSWDIGMLIRVTICRLSPESGNVANKQTNGKLHTDVPQSSRGEFQILTNYMNISDCTNSKKLCRIKY